MYPITQPPNGQPEQLPPDPSTYADSPGLPDEQSGESPPLSATFLQLSNIERRRLADQIDSDFTSAIADHRGRMNRFAHFYNLWRTPVGGPDGAIGKPNFKVPLIEWTILAKLANVVDSLFGDDAEIVADPVGPTDQETAPKVGLYMTWLVMSAMKIKSPLITLLFRCLLFGRAFVKIPYCQKTYEDASGNAQVDYEGPDFIPLYPDDLIVPAEEVTSLHEFSFVIHRYRATPDDLLRDELAGKYRPGSISDPINWARIYKAASSHEGRHGSQDAQPVRTANDGIEGITYGGQSARNTVEVQEWYGNWRMLKAGNTNAVADGQQDGYLYNGEDVGLEDWDKREMKETPLVVRRITETGETISEQRLADLYPGMKDRRPLDEIAYSDTGEYWCKGYPEMLVDTAYELTVNNNLRTEGGEGSVGPVLGVKRGEGYQFKQARWTPKMVIELDNPATDARMLDFRTDLQYTTVQEQALMSYAERVTGVSDQTLGRAIDRPNAPRTARGQIALMSKGDVRLNLDNVTLREHLSRILQRIWLIDSSYAPESVFFRVTEEKANGLFATSKGFGEMTAEERGGRYDFQLKFATSSMSREAEKEKATILTQTALMTPLVQTNPQAQWHVLNDFYKAMGRDNFKMIVPEPPPIDIPMNPDEEWTRILQGEEVHVHALDQDDLHIAKHQVQLGEAVASREPDPSANKALGQHIIEHIQQKQKKIAAAMQVAMRQAAIATVANHLGVDPAELTGQASMAPMGGQNGGQPGMPSPPQPGQFSGGQPSGGDVTQGMPGIS